MHLGRIPRRRYTSTWTPIEPMPTLSDHLGGPNLYVKRDDLLGLSGGGNKTRKLEFLMAEALAQGADTVVTTGAVQSNHCRLTLAAAVRERMRCHLVLEERVEGSYDSDAVGNNLLFKLLGAESITLVPAGTDLDAAMQSVAEQVQTDGGKPYVIPGGGSNALGALGYVACAQEIMEQTFQMGLPLDHIVCASGSGGTHAGLAAGLTATESGIALTGISVRSEKDVQETRLRTLANETAQGAGASQQIPAEAIRVRDDFVGPGYSLPTPQMTAAIQLFARSEGILLDPVYTGKAAAGLISLVAEAAFADDAHVLFVHTGGAPALHAYPQAALAEPNG